MHSNHHIIRVHDYILFFHRTSVSFTVDTDSSQEVFSYSIFSAYLILNHCRASRSHLHYYPPNSTLNNTTTHSLQSSKLQHWRTSQVKHNFENPSKVRGCISTIS